MGKLRNPGCAGLPTPQVVGVSSFLLSTGGVGIPQVLLVPPVSSLFLSAGRLEVEICLVAYQGGTLAQAMLEIPDQRIRQMVECHLAALLPKESVPRFFSYVQRALAVKKKIEGEPRLRHGPYLPSKILSRKLRFEDQLDNGKSDPSEKSPYFSQALGIAMRLGKAGMVPEEAVAAGPAALRQLEMLRRGRGRSQGWSRRLRMFLVVGLLFGAYYLYNERFRGVTFDRELSNLKDSLPLAIDAETTLDSIREQAGEMVLTVYKEQGAFSGLTSAEREARLNGIVARAPELCSNRLVSHVVGEGRRFKVLLKSRAGDFAREVVVEQCPRY